MSRYELVRDFLYREARYLDDKDWDAWLELYAADATFWMPSWDDRDQLTEDLQHQRRPVEVYAQDGVRARLRGRHARHLHQRLDLPQFLRLADHGLDRVSIRNIGLHGRGFESRVLEQFGGRVSGFLTVIICSKPLGSGVSVTGYIQLPAGISCWKAGLSMNCRNWSASLPCLALLSLAATSTWR